MYISIHELISPFWSMSHEHKMKLFCYFKHETNSVNFILLYISTIYINRGTQWQWKHQTKFFSASISFIVRNHFQTKKLTYETEARNTLRTDEVVSAFANNLTRFFKNMFINVPQFESIVFNKLRFSGKTKFSYGSLSNSY